MSRNRPTSLLSIIAGCVLLFATAFADTVTLKSGEKIEGKILSETDTEITIEVVSGGVVDERKVVKTDVASVSKMKPDELAWQSLKGTVLSENSYPTAEQYDALVAPIKAFTTQYPESEHRSAAEQLIGDIEGEKARVAEGEVKLNNEWLSKEEVERERYQVSGAIAFNYMKSQAARGDLVGAMNTFDVMEKQFDGSRAYIEAVAYVRQILPTLKAQAAQRVAALPAENAERQRGVQANVGLDRIELQKELDAEKKQIEAALADAKKRGFKWPPFLRRSEVAMKEIVKLCDATTTRLAGIDIAKAGESIKLAEEARTGIAKNELEPAGKLLTQAKQLWPKNELAIRLTAEHAAAVNAAKAVAPEPPKEETKATPKPAVKSSATPIPVASVKAAEAEDPESNPFLAIVITIIVAVLAFVGWSAYRKVVKKSNEIIE
jgi:hypothetical protein